MPSSRAGTSARSSPPAPSSRSISPPTRTSGRAGGTRSARRWARTRSPPTCGSATRATRSAWSRRRTPSASTPPSSTSTGSSRPSRIWRAHGVSSPDIVAIDVFGASFSLLALVTAGAVAAWLLAVPVVDIARRPAAPRAAPPTMELGPEPPAVANFLTNGFRVTPEAVPGTVLDLAARNVLAIEERGFGHYVCRIRDHHETLSAYEERVVELVQRRQVDGYVPVEALTTGSDKAAEKWLKAFGTDVVDEAKQRGLSQDNVTPR